MHHSLLGDEGLNRSGVRNMTVSDDLLTLDDIIVEV